MSTATEARPPDPLLAEYAPLIREAAGSATVLDLACGDGHNGLYLAGLGLNVTLADRSAEALEDARRAAESKGLSVTFWPVDFETEGSDPFEGKEFGAIIVFRYLHRSLIPAMKRALKVGGILVYETFTTAQAQFGKPHNPAFLLKPRELRSMFGDWQILHCFEGVVDSPPRAVARIVARKTSGK